MRQTLILNASTGTNQPYLSSDYTQLKITLGMKVNALLLLPGKPPFGIYLNDGKYSAQRPK